MVVEGQGLRERRRLPPPNRTWQSEGASSPGLSEARQGAQSGGLPLSSAASTGAEGSLRDLDTQLLHSDYSRSEDGASILSGEPRKDDS